MLEAAPVSSLHNLPYPKDGKIDNQRQPYLRVFYQIEMQLQKEFWYHCAPATTYIELECSHSDAGGRTCPWETDEMLTANIAGKKRRPDLKTTSHVRKLVSFGLMSFQVTGVLIYKANERM